MFRDLVLRRNNDLMILPMLRILSRKSQAWFYKLLFGPDNKNNNTHFNNWRYEILDRSTKPLESKMGLDRFPAKEVAKHWVKKEMSHPYRILLTRIRLAYTCDLLYLHTNSGDSILDVGCASGLLLTQLERRPSVGVDPEQACANVARDNINGAVCALAENLPFADASFDWLTMFEVLEHTLSPLNALRECSRVARKGVIVSVPRFKNSKVAKFAKGHFPGDSHIFELTCEDIIRLGEHAGLRCMETANLSIASETRLRLSDRILSAATGQRWPIWTFLKFSGDEY